MNKQNTNKLEVMPIPKLLLTISFPLIISMLVQALYNIVDSMFVARLGEDALAAVSLTFPVQNLIIAVATGTGVGMNALISRYLGAKESHRANVIAKNGMFLAIINGIVFALIGILASNYYFQIQTTNETIVNYGSQYMLIVCLGSLSIFVQITGERLLQSTGKTIYSMGAQGVGAIINIVLDPILIFGLFGFPALGVSGAAIATIIGQSAGALLAMYFTLKHNKEININMINFRPSWQSISEIYKIGIPAIMMTSIGSIMVFGMNGILLMFSTTAATVFGIYFKLQSFIFMPIFGLTNGLISIVAYNYGAKNKARILATYRLACCISIGIMFVGFLAFQLIPNQLLSLFEATPELLSIGNPALKTISWSFIFAGFVIPTSAFFQALGDSFYSLIISVARQLIVMLPIAYFLAYVGGLDMVWYSFLFAEIASVGSTIVLLKRTYQLKIKTL